MKKTLWFLSTILVLIVLAISISVFASEEDVIHSGTWGDLDWTLNETTGELTISGTGVMNDFSSSSTDAWKAYTSSIKTVVINEGVTSIGNHAFGGRVLTNIEIPYGVTSIGTKAFYGCENLASIEIPDSVMNIGSDAFRACRSLSSIKIPNSITSINDRVFQSCSGLTDIIIPENITSIGEDAFRLCTNLNTVYINSTDIVSQLTSITAGGQLIYNAKTILIDKFTTDTSDFIIEKYCYTKDLMQEGIEYKLYERLYDVTGTWMNLDWGLYENIGELTISGTGAMYNSTSTDAWRAYSSSIKTVIIEDGITTISDDAFRDCTSLTSVTIPDSVTSIGINAFYNCIILTSIAIPDSVTTLARGAFYKCTSLTSITIPDSVTIIGSFAFSKCTSLVSVIIGDSVTSINSYAFENCTSLASVNIGNSVTIIGDYAFIGCTSLTSITIPNSVTSIGQDAFEMCTSLTSVTIGDSVMSIGSGAFAGCTNLTKITIPDSVTNIGDTVFWGCTNLANITIPDSVNSIGSHAFIYCASLTSVTIPKGVTSIGVNAFLDCSNLKVVFIESPTVASSFVSTSANVNLIDYAEAILINESITDIDDYVTTTYTYTESLTYEGVDYVSYSLHAHEWQDCSSTAAPCVQAGFNGYECTSCGVLKGNTVIADHDYENGVCTECKKLNVALKGRNITLGGIIGLNFYFEIDPAVVNGDSYVVFTLESGREVRIPVSQGIQDTASIPGTVLYKFSCPVYSTEMSDTIAAKVVMCENESEVYERTVVSYAIALLNGNYADEDKALIKAMLNYGAYAQIEFDHNTDNLANADLDAADKVLSSDITADKFATALESSNLENIGKYAGATLLLGSETTLKAYFAPASGVNASDVTFTMNGNELTATTETMGSTTYAVVYIENISADKLDDVFTITATLGENSGTFQCSAFKYCYNVLNAATGTYSEDLINVLKAMYTYNQATIAYLNK